MGGTSYDLRGNIEYILDITYSTPFGDCTFEYSFSIDEDDYNETFVRGEALNEAETVFDCIYDIECKGTNIKEGIHRLSTIESTMACEPQDVFGSLWSSISLSLECGDAIIKCGDEVMNRIEIESKKIRGLEYAMLIEDMGYGNPIENGILDPCGRMAICPHDPVNCVAWGNKGNLIAGDFKGTSEIDENGCFKVKCKTFGLGFHSYKICGYDYIPDFLQEYIIKDDGFSINIDIESKSCNSVTNNAMQLYQTLNSLAGEFPYFLGSELYHFLTDNRNDPRLSCTEITYCTNDYRIIINNFEDVVCEPIVIDINGEVLENSCDAIEGQENGVEGLWTSCSSACSNETQPAPCTSTDFVSLTYSDLNFKCESPPDNAQVIMEQGQSTEFQSFSFMEDNYGTIYTNGIYKSDKTEYYHFIRETKYHYTEAKGLLFSYENPSDDFSFYLVQGPMYNNVKILTGNRGNFQEQFIASSDSLIINNMLPNSGNSFTIKADSYGAFLYNNDNLFPNSTSGQIILKVDELGDLDESHIISGANHLKSLSKNVNSEFYKIDSPANVITVDGVTYSNYPAGTILEIDYSGDVVIVNDDIRILGESIELISTEINSTENKKAYAFKGVGSVYFRGVQRHVSDDEKVALLNSKAGDFDWIKVLPAQIVNSVVPNIEIDEMDNIYIGMNTSVDNESTTFPIGGGGQDILIFKLNTLGSIIDTYFYASSSTEILVDIFYYQNVLFIGGNIEGDKFERSIGDLKFFNFSTNQSHGFTSFIRTNSNEVIAANSCEDCETLISLDFENCTASYNLIGQYSDKYYLNITSPSGVLYEAGFQREGTFEFGDFFELGTYTFSFESTALPCDDIIFKVVITTACISSPSDICSSVNDDATGDSDWNSSYISNGDGIVSVYFNTLQVPDELIVRRNGHVVVSSGAYSTYYNQQQVDQYYPGCNAIGGDQPFLYDFEVHTNDLIEINVVGNNCEDNGTRWSLDFSCAVNITSQELVNRNKSKVKKLEIEEQSLVKAFTDFELSPNPASKRIYINCPYSCDYSLSIHNQNGSMLFSTSFNGSNKNINTDFLSSGVYFVKLECTGLTITKKLIVL